MYENIQGINGDKMGRFRNKTINYLLIIVVLFISFFTTINGEAAKVDNSKVVKVALTNWAGFGTSKDDGLFRKYSLEYFEKLREVTGLNFEYSNYTWSEALKLLKEKKIDVVLGASYTKNRESQFTFIKPSVIKKDIDILALKNSTILRTKEVKKNSTGGIKGTVSNENENTHHHNMFIIKGKVFGIVGYFDHKYKRLLEKRAGGNTKVTVREFDSNSSLKKALLNGEIDYIIGASFIYPDEKIKRIDTLIKDKFYLVVNQDKESLINKLNEGLIELQNNDEDFNETVFAKYSQKRDKQLVLNNIEKRLLNSLDKLTFYVLKGSSLNYKAHSDGTTSGLYSKYIPKIANVLDKDYEVIPIELKDIKKLKKPGFYFDAIRNYKVINELFETKMLSNPIFEKQVLFYENRSFIKKDSGKRYVSHYPRYMQKYIGVGDEIIRSKDDMESLKFLNENKADIAIVDYSMEHYINSMIKYKNIKLVGLESDIPVSILIIGTNNQNYLNIINQAIELIPKDYLKLSIAKERQSYIYEPTIIERINSNLGFFIGILFVILIIGFVVIKVMINKNTEIEVLIEETNKTNSVKDDFISKVSHDMRTPLNAIISYSDFGIEEKRNADDVECFQKIKDNSYNLLNLMKDVLALQRLESNSNKGEKNTEVFHIGAVFVEMKTKVQALAKKKNIEFTNGFKFNSKNATSTKYVKVDKKAIKQVLSNILYNAVEYTPSGGKISWDVEITEKDDKIFAKHTISDNGIGIRKEFQNNMYNAFAVGDNELTNDNSGTGLGLAIAFKAIEILGGTISCKSELGKGSVFTINFAMEIPNASEIEVYEEKNSKIKLAKMLNGSELTEKQQELIQNKDVGELKKLAGKKVLLCEDARVNVLIVEKILSKYKIETIWAENGASGLELVRKNKFDLILMDVKMPIMDGLTATREIRKLGIRTPIVGLSGSTEEKDLKKALDIGMNDYLEKPIDKSKLVEKMLQYVLYLNIKD